MVKGVSKYIFVELAKFRFQKLLFIRPSHTFIEAAFYIPHKTFSPCTSTVLKYKEPAKFFHNAPDGYPNVKTFRPELCSMETNFFKRQKPAVVHHVTTPARLKYLFSCFSRKLHIASISQIKWIFVDESFWILFFWVSFRYSSQTNVHFRFLEMNSISVFIVLNCFHILTFEKF